jgi:HAE1 family hydrophobic/amphiphilic exporter-1
MNIFEIIVKRPFLIAILNVIIIVFGALAFFKIPVDLLPDVDFPVISVSVIYRGANPETIEKEIIEPLEDAFSGLKQLDSINATASANLGSVVLVFDLDRDGDQALQDVNEILASVRRRLPDSAESPVARKFDPGASSIVVLNIFDQNQKNDNFDPSGLEEMIDKIIKPGIEQLSDVGEVVVLGNRRKEVQIHLKTDRLRHYFINPASISQQIRGYLHEIPGGMINETKEETTIRLKIKGEFEDIEEMKNFLVETGTGTRIRLADLAEITQGLEDESRFSSYNNIPSVALLVRKQSGGNTVKAVQDIRKKISEFKEILPKNIEIQITRDNGQFIEQSLGAVRVDMFLAALLTILVVLLFLYSFRATFIALLTIPTSILGTFFVIHQNEFSLNNLTALALTLSIGLLVDDAIVVIENIYRYLEKGLSGINAAISATTEIVLPVIATTLTIASVFIPVAFMDGILGRFFYQFGITIATAVFVSTFVALTLVPMVGARLLKPSSEKPIPKFFKPFEFLNVFLKEKYQKFLAWSLKSSWNQFAVIGFGLFFLFLSLILLKFVPKTFFPSEDRGSLQVSLRLPPETSLQGTKSFAQDVSTYLQEWEDVKSVIVQIGGGRRQNSNESSLDVILSDSTRRQKSQNDIQNEMREKLNEKFGREDVRINVIGERGGGGGEDPQPIQITIQAQDQALLETYAEELMTFIRENIEKAQDITSSIPPRVNEFEINVDSRLAYEHRLDTHLVANNLYTMFNGEEVGEIFLDGFRHHMIVRLLERDRSSRNVLHDVEILNRQNQMIPLSRLGQIQEVHSPASISRKNGFKEVTVLSDFEGGDLLNAIHQIEDYIEKSKPEGIFVSFGGEAELLNDALQAVMQALGIAILMVLLILWAQFESFTPPLVILFSIPLAFSGAFSALLLSGRSLGIYAMIGLVLLIGLVTKNAIILVDFILVRIRAGLSYQEAILDACPIRLRPIMMTSIATILGMMPIAFSQGVGAEARSPMGFCVMGGMISSSFLTLFVIPNCYALMAKFIFPKKNQQS